MILRNSNYTVCSKILKNCKGKSCPKGVCFCFFSRSLQLEKQVRLTNSIFKSWCFQYSEKFWQQVKNYWTEMFYGGTYNVAKIAKQTLFWQHLRLPEEHEKKKIIIRVQLLLPNMQLNVLLLFEKPPEMRIPSDS